MSKKCDSLFRFSLPTHPIYATFFPRFAIERRPTFLMALGDEEAYNVIYKQRLCLVTIFACSGLLPPAAGAPSNSVNVLAGHGSSKLRTGPFAKENSATTAYLRNEAQQFFDIDRSLPRPSGMLEITCVKLEIGHKTSKRIFETHHLQPERDAHVYRYALASFTIASANSSGSSN